MTISYLELKQAVTIESNGLCPVLLRLLQRGENDSRRIVGGRALQEGPGAAYL